MSQSAPHVLLVDDDQELTVSASALLKRDGVQLTSAHDAVAATRELAMGSIDLVLLDLGLPSEQDGFALLEQIKSDPTTRNLPVIILTAWTRAEHKVRALDLGATDYLTKPFDCLELRARVRSALRTKDLQEALSSANRELQAARDHAELEAGAKAALLAFKSHEIRSFMNGILPNAGFLVGTQLTDEQRDYVETIRQSSESILKIVNDILDFSRIESGKLELESLPFDLRKCVEDALDTVAPKAGEKQIDLSYLMEDGVTPRVRGDAARLRQILVNLIGNAVKFTAAGEVAVDIAPEPDHRLHFTIRDTGIGIPKDKQEKLFDSFCQADVSTSRQYGGSGLGLSISRRLVELMGGRLWLESEEGKGATFHFSLSLPAASDSPGTAFSKLHSPLANLRILVVDDNPRIQSVLGMMAARWGSVPETASSLEEALVLLNTGPGFDVVLLDSTLGDLDPAAGATKLRLARNSSRTRLVLVSPVGTRCPSNLFAAHLTKPLKPAHVRDTILRLVNGSKLPPSKTTTTQPATGPLANRFPLSVLLCDDNAVNQKVASRMLSQLGYSPRLAGNGLEALQAFETARYDLVFMDIQMPEMDGLEATAKLRERQQAPGTHPHCQPAPVIVAMTASAMPGDRDRCLKAGMDDYLAKPVRPDDLRKIIEKWGPKMVESAAPGAASPAPSDPPPPPAKESEGTRDILDWERLMELADNDRSMLKELVGLYLQETEAQMAQLGAAVASHSAPDVRRLAHKCAGGSATIGVGRLVPLLRELEHRGEQGELEGTGPLYERVQKEFVILRDQLETHPNRMIESNVN